ncbi:MAG: dihydroorotate dehydrogenase [Dermatophilaceae bacterium]
MSPPRNTPRNTPRPGGPARAGGDRRDDHEDHDDLDALAEAAGVERLSGQIVSVPDDAAPKGAAREAFVTDTAHHAGASEDVAPDVTPGATPDADAPYDQEAVTPGESEADLLDESPAQVDDDTQQAVPGVPRSYVVAGRDIDMSVDLGFDMTLPNPVMTASGCAANGRELHRFFDVAELGAFVTKTVMLNPRSGRGTPRMAETPSGMLNSIGLQGPGIEAFVAEDLPWLKSVGARVLVSIAGTEPREFADVTRVLRNSEAFDAVVGIEVNISCPNVANRGLVYACDVMSTTQVLQEVRTELPPDIPAFAKLSPDVTDIVMIARAALAAGASGLTMINTLLGMQIDTDRLTPTLGGITGGLSGPAIHPIAVRAVYQVYAAMRSGRIPAAPIIGVGGIASGLDALQLIAAGACAVQVGTATFHDPHAPARVLGELAEAVGRRGFTRLSHVVGIAHTR